MRIDYNYIKFKCVFTMLWNHILKWEGVMNISYFVIQEKK